MFSFGNWCVAGQDWFPYANRTFDRRVGSKKLTRVWQQNPCTWNYVTCKKWKWQRGQTISGARKFAFENTNTKRIGVSKFAYDRVNLFIPHFPFLSDETNVSDKLEKVKYKRWVQHRGEGAWEQKRSGGMDNMRCNDEEWLGKSVSLVHHCWRGQELIKILRVFLT